jgi:hypothetical protein
MSSTSRPYRIPNTPILLDDSVRRWAERGFNADFSEVRLFTSPAPLELGCAAFTAGEVIHFGPGVYQPSNLIGRTVLAHELTHVLQQRNRQIAGNRRNGVTFLVEPELEAEAFEFGFRIASGERVDFVPHCSAALRAMESVVVQPVIVNCGKAPLHAEFRKYNGWIVAKDVYLAFFDGGAEQKVFEIGDDVSNTVLAGMENIYLQGHGSPGKVGHYAAHRVAKLISGFQFAKAWSGEIRAFCCSAGKGSKHNDSGVAELAAALATKKKMDFYAARITGAAGVALNCRSYPNGTRAFESGTPAEKTIDKEIENTRTPVDAAWMEWVKKHIPPLLKDDKIPDGLSPLSKNTLWAAAYKASEISKSFYEALQNSCKNELIESGKDLTTRKVLW